MTGRSEWRIRWRVLVLFCLAAPLAAMALLLILEWAFYVTGPTPLAYASWPTRLSVLVRGIGGISAAVLLVQALFTGISLTSPRLQTIGLLPAAVSGAISLLVAADNFTSVVFGFGIQSTSPELAWLYAVALVVGIVLLLFRLQNRLQSFHGPKSRLGAAAIIASAAVVAGIEWRSTRDLLALVSGMHEKTYRLPGDTITRRPESDFFNVLLVGVDGVPADRMSVYGYERDTTPFLRSFSRRMLVFENAFTNSGNTYSSLLALLTGRHPLTLKAGLPPLQVREKDSRLHLPGHLRAHGYATLQLTMRHYADAEDANLIDAFDWANYRWSELATARAFGMADRHSSAELRYFRAHFRERVLRRLAHIAGIQSAVDDFNHIRGEKLSAYWGDERRIETLLEFIRRDPTPWFVHLHLLDTHCCNQTPRRRIYSARSGLAGDALDDTIREADDAFRRIVDLLVETGQLDRTIIVFNTDHSSHWGMLDRLPLLIHVPRLDGARLTTPAQTIDIAPTTLDALGIEIPSWMEGSSLLDTLPAHRPIFSIKTRGDKTEVAPRLVVLKDAGPPNFGVTVLSVTYGPRWMTIDIEGKIESGTVEGYRGAAAPPSDAALESLLLAEIARRGLVFGPPIRRP